MADQNQVPMSLPKEMKYSEVLPVGVKSQRRKNVFRAAGGNKYDSKSNNKTLIDIHGDCFLNSRTSYLKFDVETNTADTKDLMFDGSAHSLIKSIVIRCGSREIERIDEYNLLHAMLADCTMTKEYRGSVGGICEGYGESGLRYKDAVNEKDWNYLDGHQTELVPTANYVTALGSSVIKKGEENKRTFCINLHCGVLQSQRYLPLLCMRGSSGIQIELTWAPIEEAFTSYEKPTGKGLDDAAQTADFVPIAVDAGDKFICSNIEYHADMVYFSSDFNANFILQMQKTGGLQIHTTGWSHSTYVSSTTSGNDECPINHRHKSVKALFCVVRDNSTLNHYESRTLTKRVCSPGSTYNFKIGGIQYPEYPITCGPGKGSEAVTALELCFGKMGDRSGSSAIDRNNFCPRVSKPEQHKQYYPMESKCVYATELEAYGSHSSLLESGINSATGAPAMSFCRLKNSEHALPVERVDCFANYDFLITVLSDLTVSSQS